MSKVEERAPATFTNTVDIRNTLTYRNKTETLSTVGSYATPTKTCVSTDSGKVFFIDMSTVNIVLQLPTAEAGWNCKIIMATASDNEGTKDFALTTGSDSVDIGGHIRQGGNSVIEITNATSCVAFDSNFCANY